MIFTARMREVSETPRLQRSRPSQPLRGGSAIRIGERVTRAIERIYRVEARVGGAELSAQALDMAVDRAVVDEDIVAIGGVHQLVAALDHARAAGERLKDHEFGDGEPSRRSGPPVPTHYCGQP